MTRWSGTATSSGFRGAYAPKRTTIDLGKHCILGVGPELNSNATIYKEGFTVTSPHVGNVRNPQTLEYLQETIKNLQRLAGCGV